MRHLDPNASFLLKMLVNTGRVGQEQTGMAWARHKSHHQRVFSQLKNVKRSSENGQLVVLKNTLVAQRFSS